ncbi:MAG: hypothetical protein FIB06_02490 [Betaproteobacteria bacterium]|nr:hypothetical protein [Betaproteobacteria bacterium]
MRLSDQPAGQRSLLLAYAASIVLHVLAFLPHKEEPSRLTPAPPQRMEARLAPRTPPTAALRPSPAQAPQAQAKPAPAKTAPKLVSPKARTPAVASAPPETPAEREEMKRFLDSLQAQPAPKTPPTLAQRSLAMARELGRERARNEDTGTAFVERRPDTPPPDPFSIDLYMDGMIRKLNRSAAFVSNDPRAHGVQRAAVHFRINPDGSLNVFRILNEADQAAQIAFIRAVIERAVPFAPFPRDLDRSVASLGITICIEPSGRGGGFGFARSERGSC